MEKRKYSFGKKYHYCEIENDLAEWGISRKYFRIMLAIIFCSIGIAISVSLIFSDEVNKRHQDNYRRKVLTLEFAGKVIKTYRLSGDRDTYMLLENGFKYYSYSIAKAGDSVSKKQHSSIIYFYRNDILLEKVELLNTTSK